MKRNGAKYNKQITLKVLTRCYMHDTQQNVLFWSTVCYGHIKIYYEFYRMKPRNRLPQCWK